MTHPTNKRERIRLKHLKDDNVTIPTKQRKVWKQSLQALEEWRKDDELRQYDGEESNRISR